MDDGWMKAIATPNIGMHGSVDGVREDDDEQGLKHKRHDIDIYPLALLHGSERRETDGNFMTT